jgi:hypothetical protein
MEPNLEGIRAYWRAATQAPNGFGGDGLVIAGSDDHQAAPRGWTGIIELLGDVVIACPANLADSLRAALSGSSNEQILDPSYVTDLLRPKETLGPAKLFYGGLSLKHPSLSRRVVGPVGADDPRVKEVMGDATEDERSESSVTRAIWGAYVALADDGTPASVCAWRDWPHQVAHMGSLTAASLRGQGYGLVAAQAAFNAAVEIGRIPQWRALRSNHASVALAQRLGLRLVGQQLSVHLTGE